MLISLTVTNGENFKEIEEPWLAALGDLEWNDPWLIACNHQYNLAMCSPWICHHAMWIAAWTC